MKFIIHDGLPYYYDGEHVYPCEVSAMGITVDMETPMQPPDAINCIYSDTEIRLPFGIMRVSSWDGRQNKMVEKSNKTVKSTKD